MGSMSLGFTQKDCQCLTQGVLEIAFLLSAAEFRKLALAAKSTHGGFLPDLGSAACTCRGQLQSGVPSFWRDSI